MLPPLSIPSKDLNKNGDANQTTPTKDIPNLNLSSFESITPTTLTPPHIPSPQKRSSMSPRAPQSPTIQMASPRQRRNSSRRQSLNDSSDKLLNLSIERSKNILELLDKDDTRDIVVQRSGNCCIYKADSNMTEKSYSEQKFMRRDTSSFSSNEKQFYKNVIQQFDEAINSLEERIPNYYTNSKPEGLISEIDLWLTLFDECINQVSPRSPYASFVMKNIMEVFQNDFLMLFEQSKKEKIGKHDGYGKKDDASEVHKLQERVAWLEAENGRLKREKAQIEEDNKKQIVENFRLKSVIEEQQRNTNQLLSTIEDLRSIVAASQQRIKEMLKDKPNQELQETFTAVPKDVLDTWTECSQFLTVILNDELTNLDFNALFPPEITKPDGTLGVFLKLNRPEVLTYSDVKNVHFSKLYYLIKTFRGDKEPNQVFNILTQKIRNLFQKFSKFTVERTEFLRKASREKAAKMTKQMNEIRNSIPEPSDWMSIIFENPDVLSIPKKGVNTNLQEQILTLFKKTDELMKTSLEKPRSAASIVQKCYTGRDLLVFLALIAKQSKSDIHADMIRRFIVNELPYHMYLQYSRVGLENEKADMRKRSTFLNSAFQNVGWNSIPQQKRRHFESVYCPSPVTFPIFAMSVYEFAIQKIVGIIGQSVKTSNLIESLKEKYNNDNMCDYLQAISKKGIPSFIEYSSVLYTFKAEKFNNALQDFDPQQSNLIEYMSTFGQKKEKKKGGRKRSQSVKAFRPLHLQVEMDVDQNEANQKECFSEDEIADAVAVNADETIEENVAINAEESNEDNVESIAINAGEPISENTEN